MNQISRTWLALGALMFLVACDHKGQHAEEGGTLEGIWLNASAFNDYSSTWNNPSDFCELVEAHSHVHGLDDEDGLHPHLIEVTREGQVVRWTPKSELGERRTHRAPVMGIDRLRLTNLHEMIRRGSDGNETFTRLDEKMATHYFRQVNRCRHPGVGPRGER